MDTIDLIRLADRGEYAELTIQLELTTRDTHSTGRGSPMTKHEKCLDEAYWYARHNEFSEAVYRLRQAHECWRAGV